MVESTDKQWCLKISNLNETKKELLNHIKKCNLKDIPVISQNALATELHLNPSTVSKYLGQLKEQGFICQNKKKEYYISSAFKSVTTREQLNSLLLETSSYIEPEVKVIFIRTEKSKTQLLAHLLKDTFPTEIISTLHDEYGILLITPKDKYDELKAQLNNLNFTRLQLPSYAS